MGSQAVSTGYTATACFTKCKTQDTGMNQHLRPATAAAPAGASPMGGPRLALVQGWPPELQRRRSDCLAPQPCCCVQVLRPASRGCEQGSATSPRRRSRLVDSALAASSAQ